MNALIIEVSRESYGKSDIRTMNVRELKSLLEEFDEELPVIFSHDNGYTYGGCHYSSFEEVCEEEEE